MVRVLNSFKIRSGDRVFDYRLGMELELKAVNAFFQKNYQVKKIWNGNRHVLGILEKDDILYFLKLSTSEGISIVTKNEYHWNNYFNKYFPKDFSYRAPENYESGIYREKYFYLITDYFEGELLCNVNDIGRKSEKLVPLIQQIIELSELIQKMPVIKFPTDRNRKADFRQKFIEKANKWFDDIPADVIKKFKINDLLKIVENGSHRLSARPRHGDFTPWHMVKLAEGRIGLIDGEHAMTKSVENYDICYFIQRVFSVLKNPKVVLDIYSTILKKGYQSKRLKTVLAARAIGGFLDESLTSKPDYEFADQFRKWAISA